MTTTFPLAARALGRRADAASAARRRLALAFVAITIGGTLPTPLYALYAERLDASTALMTVVYGAYALGALAALLLFGGLSDAVGRRPVLLGAIAVAALSSALFVLADGLPALLAARVLSGLSVGAAAAAVTAQLTDPRRLAGPHVGRGLATLANLGGLALGPVLAGVLAQHAPGPTTLTYAVHLALLALGAAAVAGVPETVVRRGRVVLRPQRLAVPASVRPVFVRAAGASAASFAVLGLFAGLAARVVRDELGSPSLVLVGLAAGATFGAAALAQLAVARLGAPRALRAGLVLLPAGLAVLVAGLVLALPAAFVLAALVAGSGAGLAFVAALALLGAAAPPDRRAEVVSSLLVVAYAAMSVPVVGVGAATAVTSLTAATIALAALAATLAVAVLAAHTRTDPRRSPQWPSRWTVRRDSPRSPTASTRAGCPSRPSTTGSPRRCTSPTRTATASRCSSTRARCARPGAA